MFSVRFGAWVGVGLLAEITVVRAGGHYKPQLFGCPSIDLAIQLLSLGLR